MPWGEGGLMQGKGARWWSGWWWLLLACRDTSDQPLFAPHTASAHPSPPSRPSFCPAVYYQSFGKCKSCGQFGTIEEEIIHTAKSGTEAINELIRNSSKSSSSSGSSRHSSRGSSGFAAGSSYDDESFAAHNYLGPDYNAADVNDVNDDLLFESSDLVQKVKRQSQSGAWVQPQENSQPRRLSEMRCEARDLRMPLFGETGEEVSLLLLLLLHGSGPQFTHLEGGRGDRGGGVLWWKGGGGGGTGEGGCFVLHRGGGPVLKAAGGRGGGLERGGFCQGAE